MAFITTSNKNRLTKTSRRIFLQIFKIFEINLRDGASITKKSRSIPDFYTKKLPVNASPFQKNCSPVGFVYNLLLLTFSSLCQRVEQLSVKSYNTDTYTCR